MFKLKTDAIAHIPLQHLPPQQLPSQRLPWANTVSYWPGIWLCAFTFIHLIIGIIVCFQPSNAINAASILVVIFFMISTSLRFTACFVPRPKTPLFDDEPDEDETFEWPYYTVFVPLYKEAAIIEKLVTHLTRLDYPRDRLEIIFICEMNDTETIKALTPFLDAPFTLLRVPEGGPRTKPNALNYALNQSHGDLITIYDAEDRPDPSQLKTAAKALAQQPNWEVVQAPLIFYNAYENMLTCQFALEYATLFYIWVPFLARLKLPFPLGGTSNHIRRSALKKVGGWDPYNVTEDADLSFRLSLKGKSFGYISTPTYEESVIDWRSWYNQRSRWIKGFMQSYNLHMHYPFTPRGKAGLKRNFTLQFTLGITLLSGILHVPFLILCLLFLGIRLASSEIIQIPTFFIVSITASYMTGLLGGLMGALRSKQYKLIWHIPIMPLYWLALFPPTLKALGELRTNPFYWNKTKHNVTQIAF